MSFDHVSEEEHPSIMDEDEWTDRNFLARNVSHDGDLEKDGDHRSRHSQAGDDTSDDAFSDLASDSDDSEGLSAGMYRFLG